jgi:EAL domain-containing protein (putative c-di-GMP-specific phosphodiesterase class I)
MSGRDEGTLADINKVGMSHGLAMLPWLKKPFRPADLRERLVADADSAVKAPDSPRPQSRKIDLDEAIANDWLELWYQPKVDLKSQSICGAEALLRVRHPQFGVMLPICVLPPSGDPRYLPLTSFVVERAMSDWQYFCDEGHALKLAVNVPVSVVQSADFVTMVRKARPKHPKFPGLIVEITEDEMIRDPQRVREAATQLKLYDASLAVDDFGTAYSSLSRLSDLPCSEVKLDRSFVSGCADDSKKQLLCKAAVELAHGFGFTICAEGVETERDRRMLVEIGCDAAQGYLFGRPMTARMLAHILTAAVPEKPEPPAEPVASVSAA